VVGGAAGPAGGVRDRGRCRTGQESVSAGSLVNALRAEGVRIDAWSQHLYPIGSPERATFFPSWRTLDQLTPLLDKLRPGIPVYVTETGYHTSYNRFHRYFVSEAQQAAWLDQTFDAADRNPRVAVTVWFNLQDNPSWTGGLLHGDLSRKPAWDRFERRARAGAVPAGWAP
jgi:GH35 family endo-1,4-beta-xylanase